MSLKLFNKEIDAVIGKVLSPHGVSGLVKAFPCTDDPDRIDKLSSVQLVFESERRQVAIESAKIHGRFWLIKFQGSDSRESAAALNGALMVIAKKNRLPLAKDSFYHDQLIGLTVYDLAGTELGTVVDLLVTGGHDLLELSLTADRGRALIPATKEFVKTVDLEARVVTVDLPQGLLDL